MSDANPVDYRRLLKNIEEILVAATFAEQGEFDTARQFLRQNKNNNKRVVLGIEEANINPKIFRYAMNLCRRVGAKLEVIHLLSSLRPDPEKIPTPPTLLQPSSGEAIEYTLVTGPGMLEEVLATHTRKRRDILFVVLGLTRCGADSPECGGFDKDFAKMFEKLNCPVVVFSEATGS